MQAVYDLVVAGGGSAGAAAAIAAADLGLHVLLAEKCPELGGNSVWSAGNLLEIHGADALNYLLALSFNKTPVDILEAYLRGLSTLRGWLHDHGAHTAEIAYLPKSWPYLPGADGVTYYHVKGAGSPGRALWDVLDASLAAGGAEIIRGTSLADVITTDAGRVVGVILEGQGGARTRIGTRHGAVLATGGFENSAAMTETYLPITPLRAVGHQANVGDGLRIAQSAGAALWHMSSLHGFWTYAADDQPAAYFVRLHGANFIMIDRQGLRFHAETGREAHDTLRPVGDFLPSRRNIPGLPAFAIFDDAMLRDGPLAPFPSPNEHQWSADNTSELASGWIKSASSTAELARSIGIDARVLELTVSTYNAAAAAGFDAEFGRSPATMAPLNTGSLHALELWPGIANTSGGPRRDRHARVVRSDGSPIPGLFAAGSLGTVWGHLADHGAGLTDGLVFGRIAAEQARRLPPADVRSFCSLSK